MANKHAIPILVMLVKVLGKSHGAIQTTTLCLVEFCPSSSWQNLCHLIIIFVYYSLCLFIFIWWHFYTVMEVMRVLLLVMLKMLVKVLGKSHGAIQTTTLCLVEFCPSSSWQNLCHLIIIFVYYSLCLFIFIWWHFYTVMVIMRVLLMLVMLVKVLDVAAGTCVEDFSCCNAEFAPCGCPTSAPVDI
eukprot:scaffold10231_cov169-Skeletonema_menzelii.AAC.1